MCGKILILDKVALGHSGNRYGLLAKMESYLSKKSIELNQLLADGLPLISHHCQFQIALVLIYLHLPMQANFGLKIIRPNSNPAPLFPLNLAP